MNADAHTNVFIMHTHALSNSTFMNEQMHTHKQTHTDTCLSEMDGKFHLFPLCVTVRPGRSTHLHTHTHTQPDTHTHTHTHTHTDTHTQTHTHTHTHHITVCDLSQCHASTDSIRGEPLFFSYLLFYFPILSLFRAHTHTHTHAHTPSFVSQLEPNNFSLNVPTALTMELNTDIQRDHTHTHTHTHTGSAREMLQMLSYCWCVADIMCMSILHSEGVCVCVCVCVCVWATILFEKIPISVRIHSWQTRGIR